MKKENHREFLDYSSYHKRILPGIIGPKGKKDPTTIDES